MGNSQKITYFFLFTVTVETSIKGTVRPDSKVFLVVTTDFGQLQKENYYLGKPFFGTLLTGRTVIKIKATLIMAALIKAIINF